MFARPSKPTAPKMLPGLPTRLERNEVGEAKKMNRAAETHFESPQNPGDQDHGESDEGQHHAVHRPTFLHDPAVKHGETGNAHQAGPRVAADSCQVLYPGLS